MTKQVQRRRGTATQHTSFTGAEGELSVNTTNKSVHVHDNVTAGGFEAARADMDNVTSSSILTAAGITATTAELNYVDGVTSAIQTQLDGKAGTASPTFTGTLTTANLTATGTTTLAGASTSADITFGDNDKAVFGAGSDLQIYHDSVDGQSMIQENGTGQLILDTQNGARVKLTSGDTAKNMVVANKDGDVELYYDNAIKLATTSTGIDVTGTVTADGLTVDGNGSLLTLDNGSNPATLSNTNGNVTFDFDTTNAGRNYIIQGNSLNVFSASNGGDISFYDSLGSSQSFFWDASAERLGIGTTSPSNLLDIQSSTASGGMLELNNTGDTSRMLFISNSDGMIIRSNNSASGAVAKDTIFQQGTVEAMRIDSSGNVGINTSSVQSNVKMQIVGEDGASGAQANVAANELFVDNNGNTGVTVGTSNTGVGYYAFADSDVALRGGIFYNHTDDAMGFRVLSAEAMRIDSSGNTHIGGTASITTAVTGDNVAPKLIVEGTTATSIAIFRRDTSVVSGNSLGSLGFYGSDTTSNTPTPLAGIQALASGTHAAGDNPTDLRFFTTPDNSATMAEAMRIDSSGNLLVGTTTILAAESNVEGISLAAGSYGGLLSVSRAENRAATFNRKTSDGDIVQFRKDGAPVGSIGTDDNASDTNKTIYICSGNSASSLDVGFKFDWSANQITPCQASGANRDDAVDMGSNSVRFDDIYATNGTIQTSDANEKQDIAELSDAEQRVAVAAKGLLRKFRWKNAVAEKGDEARTHFGIIAQDLQAAFAAEGLDAGDYAMFISSTWTDEETGEERTRMGVRYSELLAFIIAAI